MYSTAMNHLFGVISGCWWAIYIVHGVAESRTQLSDFTFTFQVAAAAKSLQSCPTLCDAIDGSPPGSAVPGILQARILEWVAISFSNTCMRSQRQQPTRLLHPWDSPGKNTGVGCHFLLHVSG